MNHDPSENSPEPTNLGRERPALEPASGPGAAAATDGGDRPEATAPDARERPGSVDSPPTLEDSAEISGDSLWQRLNTVWIHAEDETAITKTLKAEASAAIPLPKLLVRPRRFAEAAAVGPHTERDDTRPPAMQSEALPPTVPGGSGPASGPEDEDRRPAPASETPGGDPGDADADYHLLHEIGRGGMGVVYAARQSSMNRTIAVKMIRGGSAGDPDARAKFLSEAAVTGELDHPNIVPVHELGANDGGDLFYAMKKVGGTPWSHALPETPRPRNLEILLRVCDAVAFAHDRRVLHRDLKPDNVMLGDFGEVLLMDWGLAVSLDGGGAAAALTPASAAGGTPAYMAPEMAFADCARIGPASDVYLLGAILFEILTGFPPHHGDNAMSCLEAAARNRIRPTAGSGELFEIARTALASDPADRYPTVQAFQEAIRAYRAHAESIALATSAEAALRRARASGDYGDYSHARYAYMEALDRWPGNEAARAGLLTGMAAYAEHACGQEDFDLALALIAEAGLSGSALENRARAGRRAREQRARQVRQLRWAVSAVAAILLAVLTLGYLRVSHARRVAERARVRAREAEGEAMQALASEAALRQASLERQARWESSTRALFHHLLAADPDTAQALLTQLGAEEQPHPIGRIANDVLQSAETEWILASIDAAHGQAAASAASAASADAPGAGDRAGDPSSSGGVDSRPLARLGRGPLARRLQEAGARIRDGVHDRPGSILAERAARMRGDETPTPPGERPPLLPRVARILRRRAIRAMASVMIHGSLEQAGVVAERLATAGHADVAQVGRMALADLEALRLYGEAVARALREKLRQRVALRDDHGRPLTGVLVAVTPASLTLQVNDAVPIHRRFESLDPALLDAYFGQGYPLLAREATAAAGGQEPTEHKPTEHKPTEHKPTERESTEQRLTGREEEARGRPAWPPADLVRGLHHLVHGRYAQGRALIEGLGAEDPRRAYHQRWLEAMAETRPGAATDTGNKTGTGAPPEAGPAVPEAGPTVPKPRPVTP